MVAISRLFCRKGADLLVGTTPQRHNEFPNADFAIGSDGSKCLSLEETAKREQTQCRVKFLGSVPHENVLNASTQGHMFLNFSLTE